MSFAGLNRSGQILGNRVGSQKVRPRIHWTDSRRLWGKNSLGVKTWSGKRGRDFNVVDRLVGAKSHCIRAQVTRHSVARLMNCGTLSSPYALWRFISA